MSFLVWNGFYIKSSGQAGCQSLSVGAGYCAIDGELP